MPFSFPSNPSIGATSTQNGRSYTYAGNNVWELAASGGEDAVLRALFVPPAPTGLTVTEGNAQASLSWTAPTGVIAQAPITDYREQFSTDNGATWTTFTAAASTATTATVTGLSNGQAVRFRVAAVNGVGVGAYTAASSAVTPTAGDPLFGSVQLLLRADSLADSSSYARTVTASGASVSTSTKKYGSGSFSIAGSGQYIAVAGSSALNMSGDFCIEWWQNLASATAQGWIIGGNVNANGYLMLGINLSGSGQLWMGGANTNWPVQFGSLSFSANTFQHIAVSRTGSTNRLYIDGTLVGTVTDSTSWVANPSSVWIGSQAGGTSLNGFIDEFRWTVGNNRSYTSATITVPTAAFPDVGPMSAPTSLAATGGNAQVSLTWTAPSYNGGSAITDYSVQFSSNSGSTWTTFSRTASTTASQVVTGLTNGTAYVFRVAGMNSNGTGTYTAASSSVTPIAGTPPNAPTSLTATAGNAQLSLAWTAPSAPGTSAISGYTVEYTPSGGSAQTVSTGSTSTSYTLTGLTNGTAYTVRVAGVSAVGTGTYSGTATGTPNSVLLAISGSDTANWTGSGTAASKFTRGSAISRNGCNEIFPFVFEALATATFRASGSTTDNSGDTDDLMEIQIWNNALSSVVSTLFIGRGSFNVTASISAGQKVRWRKSCNSAGDHQLNGGVTVWAE